VIASRSRSFLVLCIASGWATGVSLYALMAAIHWYAPKGASWEPPLATLLTAFATIGPGFVAGYFAARAGFIVGAAAGVLTSIVNSIFIAQLEARSIMELAELPSVAVPEELAFAVAAAFVGGVCGIAGVKVAQDSANRRGG
jgi:hypothetical protein